MARRNQPAQELGAHIVADPKICHGQPTFRGTRILVAHVLEQVERGLAWSVIREEWDGRLPDEAIAEAVKLARVSFLAHTPPAPAGRRPN